MSAEKYLSEAERLELESFLIERLESDTRNALVILVALHSGARAKELLALDWADIDLKTGAVKLRTLKRYKRKPGETEAEAKPKREASAKTHARPIVLPKALLGPLRAFKLRSSGAKPFPISYNRLGEIWRLYRTVAKPFHSLRHSFAMKLYNKSKDLRFVSKCLGHANLATTSRYLEKSYSTTEFKKLMGMR